MIEMKAVPCLVICLLAGVNAGDFTDEEYYSLPLLFHLDRYDACLSSTDGLYCLGTFHLTSEQRNPIYKIMQEYSNNSDHYNHTQLHRGYCVSARCPHTAPDWNSTQRFERCAQELVRGRSLRSSLHQLHYCHTHKDANTSFVPDTPQIVFVAIVAVFVVINVIGTTYDLMFKDELKKSKVLCAWSVISNWQRLISDRVHSDPARAVLLPLEGVRVVLLAIVVAVHTGFIHYMLYAYDPRALERMMQHPLLLIVKNGTAMVQCFMVLASFLFAYNILLHSKNHEVTFRMLPKCIFHRYIRLTPVQLAAVGWAAWWWSAVRGGPQWALAREEAAVCRRRLWLHALYLHNLLEPQHFCLLPTWSLAVDMQLHLVAVVLTLALIRMGRRAVPILAAMFLGSCLLNAYLIYIFEWKSMLYVMNPQNTFMKFVDVPSFYHFYISPWGSLPSCLLGLLLANIHFQQQLNGFKATEYKWFVWTYKLSVPLIVGFTYTGYFVQQYTSSVVTTAHTALERPLFVLLFAIFMLGTFNKLDSIFKDILSWRIWRPLARMSLSVLTVHWCVTVVFVAARPQPLTSSYLDIMADWMVTMIITYIISMPVTILIEMPVQRFFTALLF
ncbi:O-acyltransferase like protein-like [Galleria mellonella]|uniref:O-acyltransferase like protein-like n=1 Tax=Galleria mellonella TaxID=7137 RepID=A0ABM3MJW9_GALME|nr:O-acyltransferase like protein-like [Galleria mellonella]